MGKISYFNEGGQRRQQIANWVEQEIYREGKQFFIKEIEFDIIQEKYDDAFDKFNALLISFQDETLVYLILNNKQLYGNQVIVDLMNRIVKAPRTIKKKDVGNKGPKQKISSIKRKIVTREFRVYGIDKNNKRRLAKVDSVIVNNKARVVLRDTKTGRFLKATESFKRRTKND